MAIPTLVNFLENSDLIYFEKILNNYRERKSEGQSHLYVVLECAYNQTQKKSEQKLQLTNLIDGNSDFGEFLRILLKLLFFLK